MTMNGVLETGGPTYHTTASDCPVVVEAFHRCDISNPNSQNVYSQQEHYGINRHCTGRQPPVAHN